MSRRHHEHGSRHGRRSRASTPEERAYRQARRRAYLKLSFITHFVAYATVCVFLAVVARPAVKYVAFGWGIGIVLHYFMALVLPGLRRRIIEREVQREVAASVSRERRDIEDRHARSLEQLSASIAHEIRNPITAAKSLVQQMGEDPSSRENVEYAGVALQELDRVERSISHLLRYAREEELEMRELGLADVIDSALETFRDRIARLGVRLEREVDGACRMRGDPEKLRRVVINLVGNALDALEASATRGPSLAVLAGENLAGSELWLRVKDNGPGMDEATLQKIFSPFYTSKVNGTGLGLALAKKVVEAHGGSIEAHSAAGDGTEFVLVFPKRSGDGDSRRGARP